MKHETRVIKMTTIPEGQAIHHEAGYTVEIVDEGGGEFLEIRSNEVGSPIRVNPEDWPHLRAIVDKMIGMVR